MKNLLFGLLLLSTNIFASTTVERVISDQTIKTNLLLDTTTVRCSRLGYGNSQLKISVPDLDYYTFFDHSNIGEALPCMTAGACELKIGEDVIMPGYRIEDIVDILNPRAEMEIKILLKEIITLNSETQVCSRAISEELSGELRGIKFTHYRFKSIGEVSVNVCDVLIQE